MEGKKEVISDSKSDNEQGLRTSKERKGKEDRENMDKEKENEIKNEGREIGISGDNPEDDDEEDIIVIPDVSEDEQIEFEQESGQKLEALEKEKVDLIDKYLRLQAEFDNYRKRLAKEKQDMFKYKYEDFLRDFLPILDQFKIAFSMKALDSHDEESRTFYEGFRMIYESMLMLLDKYDVKMMDIVGKPFDPRYHDAVAREESDEYPDNTIIDELSPGYIYKDKVLIHPRVKVAISKK